MAQARELTGGQSVNKIAVGMVLAVLLGIGAITASVSLDLFGGSARTVTQGATNPTLINAEAEWVRQRLAQGGYVDPALRSALQWERERLAQRGAGH